MLELAGNVARDKKMNQIVPTPHDLAVWNDEKLSKLLPDRGFAAGGVMPSNIHQARYLFQEREFYIIIKGCIGSMNFPSSCFRFLFENAV